MLPRRSGVEPLPFHVPLLKPRSEREVLSGFQECAAVPVQESPAHTHTQNQKKKKRATALKVLPMG